MPFGGPSLEQHRGRATTKLAKANMAQSDSARKANFDHLLEEAQGLRSLPVEEFVAPGLDLERGREFG
eukprot:814943-Rhodomonas_salina.2